MENKQSDFEKDEVKFNLDTLKNKGYNVKEKLGEGGFAVVYKAISE